MKRLQITRTEEFTVQAREGVTFEEMKAMLDAKIEQEGMKPDFVQYRSHTPKIIYRFTPKRHLRRIVGSIRAVTALACWQEVIDG